MSFEAGRNGIRRIHTEEWQTEEGHNAAIMVALDLDDVVGLDVFVRELVPEVLARRMMSPPDTSLILFTLMGSIPSADFANLWKRHVAAHEAMRIFMARMTVADVIHGDAQGTELDRLSLL